MRGRSARAGGAGWGEAPSPRRRHSTLSLSPFGVEGQAFHPVALGLEFGLGRGGRGGGKEGRMRERATPEKTSMARPRVFCLLSLSRLAARATDAHAPAWCVPERQERGRGRGGARRARAARGARGGPRRGMNKGLLFFFLQDERIRAAPSSFYFFRAAPYTRPFAFPLTPGHALTRPHGDTPHGRPATATTPGAGFRAARPPPRRRPARQCRSALGDLPALVPLSTHPRRPGPRRPRPVAAAPPPPRPSLAPSGTQRRRRWS